MSDLGRCSATNQKHQPCRNKAAVLIDNVALCHAHVNARRYREHSRQLRLAFDRVRGAECGLDDHARRAAETLVSWNGERDGEAMEALLAAREAYLAAQEDVIQAWREYGDLEEGRS